MRNIKSYLLPIFCIIAISILAGCKTETKDSAGKADTRPAAEQSATKAAEPESKEGSEDNAEEVMEQTTTEVEKEPSDACLGLLENYIVTLESLIKNQDNDEAWEAYEEQYESKLNKDCMKKYTDYFEKISTLEAQLNALI